MNPGIIQKVLMASCVSFCFLVLAGCGSVEFGPKPEFAYTWVSTEGKSAEQLQADQTECRRDLSMMTPPPFSGPSGMSGGWDLGDMKTFERCMRAKGWVKR